MRGGAPIARFGRPVVVPFAVVLGLVAGPVAGREAALPVLSAATAAAVAAQPATPERSTGALARAAAARESARRAARFDPIFQKYTKRYFGIGFDWRQFKAQAMAESNLDTAATSWVGARGLMQLMPSTYAMIQSRRPEFGSIDDPEWNIAAGIMHNRYLWKAWPEIDPDTERARFMFGSYNAGEGPITRAHAAAKARQLEPTQWASIEQVAPTVPRWRYRETLGYVRKIESNYERLRGRELPAASPGPAPPP